tara:strand:- start:1646 stop:2590 length:945 start_codon:yes stop_codon:yes gene_type:complete
MKTTLNILLHYCLFILAFSGKNFAQEKKINLFDNDIPCKSDLKLEINYDGKYRVFKKVGIPQIWHYPVNNKNQLTPAVIIIPGGGYSSLSFDKEGIEIAEWFNSFGVSAFVLNHRLPEWESEECKSISAIKDAERAIRLVRSKSKEWNIDSKSIGVIGFSAGGHLASTVSTHFDYGSNTSQDEIERTSSRPDFSILVYPVISMKKSITHYGTRENLIGKNPSEEKIKFFSGEHNVSYETPPTILIHSNDDTAVKPENSINYFLALKKHNIPAALHIWEKGGHGYGISEAKGAIRSWPEVVRDWMIQRKIISRLN